ncbi:unknown [Bacteroides stercoris CAG:120]|nr:unknown [Bacteroides stercoris CAG:120]
MLHGKSLATLLRVARTDVGTVTATQTVENVYLHTECHAFECLTHCFQLSELSTLLLFSVEYERTDRSVRTNVSTLVTLDTVFRIPFGNESCHTAFFVLSRTLFPSTVFDTLECRYFQQVTVLCIDRTNHFVDECGVVVFCFGIIRQVSPCRVDSQSLVFAATVYGCVVLVYYVFTLLAVRLDDEFLHLLNSLFYRNYTCDTEECRLENGVGTVAQTDFLCNLSCVDVVNGDIVLCKVFLYSVRQVLSQLFTFPDGVQQE